MLADPRCHIRSCRFFSGSKSDGNELTERPVCVAFPEGIPSDIAYGDNLHLSPVKGDHGIQFQQDPLTVDDEKEDLNDYDDVLGEPDEEVKD